MKVQLNIIIQLNKNKIDKYTYLEDLIKKMAVDSLEEENGRWKKKH